MIVPIFHMIAGVIVSVFAAPQVRYYASRYDHLDVEAILNNRRMVNYYAACLLSKGPCPPQGLEFKQILPEALQTTCARCTEKQKTVTYRTIRRLKKEYPKIWDQLFHLWDPDDIYVRKFEAAFENYKPTARPIATASTTTTAASTTVTIIGNRFGDQGDSTSEAASAVALNNDKPYPPPDYYSTSTVSTTSTTFSTTTATTSSSKTTKSTNTQRPFLLTSRKPTFGTVGTNLQATVSFVAAIKNIAIQLYQHKVETLRRILAGR